MDAGEINHGLAGKGLVLIVSAQTPIPSEPSESAFHNPATRSDLKSFGFGRATHNLESPTELLFDPGDDVFVSAISPNQLEATPAIVDTMLDGWNNPARTSLPPLPSGILAQWTITSNNRPKVSTIMWRLRLGTCLWTSTPRSSPPSDVFTLWLSIMPALGCGSRPWLTRTLCTRTVLIFSHKPELRHCQ
jgi:hypothetical protein